ncbi:MAG: IS982 family transposase [Alphaproteobacteria bacterium]|nr:IS982 family transposase [Alphaproteobacteria bacterium]
MLAPIVEIFCDIDDFKDFYPAYESFLLPHPHRQRKRPCRLQASEIMTIMILFHMSHYRTFKDFFHECILREMRSYFPNIVSYNRFIEIQGSVAHALIVYMKCKAGEKTGVYYVDSTPLAVCHNKRILRHKVFKDIAKRGQTSMGWFFGWKLHLVLNHQGEIMTFCVTPGNVDDRKPLIQLLRGLKGLAFGDKGYLCTKRAEELAQKGISMITKVKKNMKKRVLSCFQKFCLSKRGMIETVIDQLKNLYQIHHTRHRKPDNFIINLLAGLTAYTFKPNKIIVPIGKLPEEFNRCLMSS